MALLRKGRVRVPHRDSDTVTITRLGGMPQRIHVNSILSFEDTLLVNGQAPACYVLTETTGFLVMESYDAVDELVNGEKAVSHA